MRTSLLLLVLIQIQHIIGIREYNYIFVNSFTWNYQHSFPTTKYSSLLLRSCVQRLGFAGTSIVACSLKNKGSFGTNNDNKYTTNRYSNNIPTKSSPIRHTNDGKIKDRSISILKSTVDGGGGDSNAGPTPTDILSNNTSQLIPKNPVLVVGGTGRVGRIVVQKLIQNNYPVRVLVRNVTKAKELFGTIPSSTVLLQLYQVDLGNYYDQYKTIVESAICGCDSIISVSGVIRFSKIRDFVPWRIMNLNSIERWAEDDHPYYGNYIGQKVILELATKYNVRRFIRVTGLGLAYPIYNPFVILFNLLLSCNFRWNLLCEHAIRDSGIPYVIIRPGGLAEEERTTETTNIQIDPTGKLPFPGRIGRTDVAELCIVAATDFVTVPYDTNYTIACRWVGSDVKPKPQGVKEDGYASAKECFEQIAKNQSNPIPQIQPTMKPYGAVVALTFYSLVAVSIKICFSIMSVLSKIVLG